MEDFINKNKDDCDDIVEKIEIIAKFAKLANEIFINGTNEIKKEVVSLIASNIVIEDQKITNFSLKEPFVWLLKNDSVPTPLKTTFEPSSIGYNKAKTTTEGVAVCEMRRGRDSNPGIP